MKAQVRIASEIKVAKTFEEEDWPASEELEKGRFTSYCKQMGFDGPCRACAEKALESDDASVRGMASFYLNTVKPAGTKASIKLASGVKIADLRGADAEAAEKLPNPKTPRIPTLDLGIPEPDADKPTIENANGGERHLIMWHEGKLSGFWKLLWDAMASADDEHLATLAKGFPEDAEAMRRFREERGYWGSLKGRTGHAGEP